MSDTHAQTVRFVRDSMIEPQEPPISETGVIRWVRENLFSGWLNILLTVVSLAVIYFALSHLLPWFLQMVWNAGSLSECREIRNERYGPDAASACFAVIRERWHQLLFGFYPVEAYWRAVLGFVVFLAGMSPVLFTSLPRKLLWASAATPFVCYALFWGGSIWGPVATALGFAIGAGAYSLGFRAGGKLAASIAAIVVPILYWLFLAGPLARALTGIAPIGLPFIPSDDFGGFMLSTIIGLSAILLSLPLGILLALGRQSHLFIINKVSIGFIEIIRGVPLIVWLFTASLLLNYFLPPGTNFDLMLRVIIMATLFSSAYIAEVVRGGLAALPSGQYEGADSLGLDYWQSMRLIILPQALKISIPGIVNTFIGLFKDTTLVVFIGLLDPIGLSNSIRATTEWNGIYWELFVFIGVLFFICCFSMSRYSIYLERKLQRENR
ncbi:L-glutamine ABC transporter membrane protein /L-glutamate ABC transporter membrane protein /L-aspartate ABC transporter membrane protein /L-asparagine ABC transporter membrane protein [Tranquillimonas rosea]|uniref:L-glutamine ABC transporter membrane protein /L-glutamate ABC transporter membrane protein /L-aspartate ABC transporter membrane protein /L-asparagine ABC transporter membrane protein n=1 Tax=Tranquillimonas rosea TaxID=641238 RepID=A0A1H9X6H5_9RHOB|nr:amino acid ABC transporter permease [Tranquillimonas rosea]SES41818.1 L-glutamine ABC transporter membrane protein /L-glutamate ABC transporter membrane protein /L-aspartate ABC transporter membrane protein /L-asparagine ABC transporter membrane protein [Tranquillimonas rosea]